MEARVGPIIFACPGLAGSSQWPSACGSGNRLPGTSCVRWQEREPIPEGTGRSLSMMAQLTPVQRQRLFWASRACHLLMLPGPGPPGLWAWAPDSSSRAVQGMGA